MIIDIILSVSQLPRLCKQGISDFSKVRLADTWCSELTSPLDRVKSFSEVMGSPYRQHFFCCEKRNLGLDKESFEKNCMERKQREMEILEWKLDALESVEKYPFERLEQNLLERERLERKYSQTLFLKSALLGIAFHKLKSKQRRFLTRELLGGKLSESYSNAHASPRVYTPLLERSLR